MKPSCRVQILAVVLSFTMILTGCTANWISVALADLPVLLQIATSIAGLVSTIQSGSANPSESQAIAQIGAQAQTDLTLIQTLYNEYKTQPNQTNVQKIQDAIATANSNIGALLSALHISDPVLSNRVTAGVQLILTTINAFAALIPVPSPAAAAAQRTATKVPSPSDLQHQWQDICSGDQACIGSVK